MSLPDGFQSFIREEKLFDKKDRLLLAVSGGVDSVVLCELCATLGYDFVIAHCNFQLRGAESDRDEDFVRRLAKRYNAELRIKEFDTQEYAQRNKLSIQVAARELRYAWFNECINDDKPVDGGWRILTAHHLDDNVETLLMHFFRGSGISGLRGILPKQGALVRPLLFARKGELLDFARARGLEWVEDSSNQSDKYQRNYFRNELLPVIRSIMPQAEENLADNLQRFRDIEILYQQAIQKHKKRLLKYKSAEVHIPVASLKLTKPLASVFYEIIKDYGFASTQLQEALELLYAGTGKYIQSASHRILKNRKWLIITPLPSVASSHILIEQEDALVDFERGRLKFEMTGQPASIPADPAIGCLDATHLKFPLLLRRWKAGDYFYPLGMRKKKKLARFFIDQKLSAVQKEKIWVLESDKKIIWVIGMRIDDRYKITTHTKKTLLVRLKALNI